MKRNFKEALKHRRSYYELSNESPVSDEEIEEMVKFAVEHVPSAFNSQTARIVLLLGEHHREFWSIVKETLRTIVAEAAFEATEKKINTSFASGYGTILFFEDQQVVETLQRAYPLYHEKFPDWSHHTSAMHQLALWTMLEDAGFGASLQHYNPLIDEEVMVKWTLPEHWNLIAQMPFGKPLDHPGKKEQKPLSDRLKIFK